MEATGRIKRIVDNGIVTPYEIDDYGNIRNIVTGNVLNHNKNNKGYCTVTLHDAYQNYHKTHMVHILVATAFIPNPYGFEEVDHLDCNSNNNCVSNLEWVTSEENKRRAKKNGLIRVGEEHGESLYTNSQIEEVCKLLEDGKLTWEEISKTTGVKLNTIHSIRNRKTWRFIGDRFIFPEKHATYSEDQIVEVCRLLEEGSMTHKQISDETGVKIHTVNDIRNHRKWTFLSEGYVFINKKQDLPMYYKFIDGKILNGIPRKEIVKKMMDKFGLSKKRAKIIYDNRKKHLNKCKADGVIFVGFNCED